MGAPRIVPTRGIPYPTGDPSLDAAAERKWRRQLVERALEAVATSVSSPTLFPVEPGGSSERDKKEPAHA